MSSSPALERAPLPLLERYPSLPWVLPFALFMALLALQDSLLAHGRWEYPARVGILAAALWFFSRHVISLRTVNAPASVAVGLAVFALWIAPDLLIPGYRQHWLFQNAVTGQLQSSIDPELVSDPMVLFFRTVRAVILVPVIEELFWRGWVMRWLINPNFRQVPLGTYSAQAFWITAALFASEHGPYWDVGLLAGIVYNWWMIRTRSLGDCILMHAATNAALSGFVVATGRWEYWF